MRARPSHRRLTAPRRPPRRAQSARRGPRSGARQSSQPRSGARRPIIFMGRCRRSGVCYKRVHAVRSVFNHRRCGVVDRGAWQRLGFCHRSLRTRSASGQPDSCWSNRQARRGHPDRRCDRRQGVWLLPQARREAAAYADLLSAQYARRLADGDSAHGGLERLANRPADGSACRDGTCPTISDWRPRKPSLPRSKWSAGLLTISTRPTLMPKASARSAIRWVASSRSAGRAKNGTC